MKKTNLTLIWSVAAILIIAGIFFLIAQKNREPGELDEFATCLKDKGVVFYGVFWCSHCQNQKKFFGNSARLLSYVECSTPDGRGTLEICKNKNIESYPTWEFADGSREVGEVSLQRLAEKTGCQLTQ